MSWQGDQGEEDGGGQVREDHCLDEADSFGERGGGEVGNGRDDVRDEEEGAELTLGELEFPVEEIGYPG